MFMVDRCSVPMALEKISSLRCRQCYLNQGLSINMEATSGLFEKNKNQNKTKTSS